jgi:UDP-glucose 4-epimerase
VDFSLDQLDFLVHGRVVDVRRLIDDFDYSPRSTPEAFDDFIAGHGMGAPVHAGGLDEAERLLRAGGRAVLSGLRSILAKGGRP